MVTEYVCNKCGLELIRVGTKIFRHRAAMHPKHDPRFPPKTCGTKPSPVPVGVYLARINARRGKNLPHRQPKRTIDISEYSDTLLHFWATQRAAGKSYRELGMAYGMNGLQMRSAIAQWRKKNVART